MRLEDRVAIVTGAGSGIGAASAAAIRPRGGHVYAASKGADDAAMITGSCIQVDGGRCI